MPSRRRGRTHWAADKAAARASCRLRRPESWAGRRRRAKPKRLPEQCPKRRSLRPHIKAAARPSAMSKASGERDHKLYGHHLARLRTWVAPKRILNSSRSSRCDWGPTKLQNQEGAPIHNRSLTRLPEAPGDAHPAAPLRRPRGSGTEATSQANDNARARRRHVAVLPLPCKTRRSEHGRSPPSTCGVSQMAPLGT